MTAQDFAAEMDRMIGLRFPPASYQTHLEGLAGIPADVLHKAVTHAIQTRREFPTPSELRQDCDTVHGRQESAPLARGSEILAEPIPLGQLPDGTPLPPAGKLWRYYCETCSDGGWESVWCGVGSSPNPWVTVHVDCGRFGEHPPHEFTRRCACWHSNPELQRKRDQQRQYAAQRVEKGRAA
jgi:hypothetical protein